MKVMKINTKEIEKFWALEHLGIVDPPSVNGEEMIKNSLKRNDDGQFVASWPMKSGMQPGHNRDVAVMREKRLKLSAEQEMRYKEQIDSMLRDNYLEEVQNLPNDLSNVTFLPHRPVFKETSATTKTRMVVDPSSSKKGEWPLNECMETGPTALPKVPGVLMRFRVGEVGVIADIEKAFLRILLSEESRNRCCITWKGKVYRFTSVPFGVKASPGVLQVVVQVLLNENIAQFPEVAQALKRAMYVDDCIDSCDSAFEAESYLKSAKLIFESAKMSLHKTRIGGGPESKVLGIS